MTPLITRDTPVPVLKLVLILAEQPQYLIAERVGMNETRLSRIANGLVRGTDQERNRIADYFQMPVATLFDTLRIEDLRAALHTAEAAI